MYDPVFPTKSVAFDLKPKPLVDWRSTGRTLLIATLARLEGFRLRSITNIMSYQAKGYCSPMCASTCSKSYSRVFCVHIKFSKQFKNRKVREQKLNLEVVEVVVR